MLRRVHVYVTARVRQAFAAAASRTGCIRKLLSECRNVLLRKQRLPSSFSFFPLRVLVFVSCGRGLELQRLYIHYPCTLYICRYSPLSRQRSACQFFSNEGASISRYRNPPPPPALDAPTFVVPHLKWCFFQLSVFSYVFICKVLYIS